MKLLLLVIVKMLEYNLKKEGFKTLASRDGEAALLQAGRGQVSERARAPTVGGPIDN